MPEQRIKKYVEVIADFQPDGTLFPEQVTILFHMVKDILLAQRLFAVPESFHNGFLCGSQMIRTGRMAGSCHRKHQLSLLFCNADFNYTELR